jgi:ankyrin repeat protein
MAAKVIKSKHARAFVKAAYRSSIPEMRRLLNEGADINGIYNDETALHAAVRRGNRKMLAFLIDAGADVNALDRFEKTPLMTACGSGSKRTTVIVLDLIQAGADLHYGKDDEWTAMMIAAGYSNPQVVQALIDEGAPVDGPSKWRQTPLMLAARANNVENLKVLVANGANLKRKCTLPWANGANALELARMEKRQKSVKYLEPLY